MIVVLLPIGGWTTFLHIFSFLLPINFDFFFFFFVVGRCNDRAKRKATVRDGGGEERKERGGEKGKGKRKQRKKSGAEYARRKF